jgi:hypothetical protein
MFNLWNAKKINGANKKCKSLDIKCAISSGFSEKTIDNIITKK